MPRLHVPGYQKWRVYVFSAAQKNARLTNRYPVANTLVDSGWGRSDVIFRCHHVEVGTLLAITYDT